jgi:hypothetical protein
MIEMNYKGIFATISVFFLMLVILMLLGVISSIHSANRENLAQSTDISQINSIKSNIEWMAKETFSVSGFRFSVYNKTLSIEENSTKRGTLTNDFNAMEEFWNGVADKNVSLELFEEAGEPIIYIKPANITIRQDAVNTSITVPDYSNSSILAYYISMETNCSALGSNWLNISETSIDPLNFTIDIQCTDSSDSYSDFRQLERFDYSELQIIDSGSNLTVIKIMNLGSLEIQKSKSAYLNIILPMNESVYYEIPSDLNITKGDASYNGAIRIPG